ncbi:glucose transporter, lmgt2 [Angomonas deanei]|nr:glucose transporter, lmgt2 [Angomonas deanei]|eukprot:EPY31249.1 glucose transporter, lmgt2 [Angomonas deanei]
MSGNREGELDNAEQRMEVEDPDAHVKLFSMRNIKVAQVNFFCGILNGYNIGFVGVYTTLYGQSTNCAVYTAQVPCETLSNAKCMWDATNNICTWPEITCQLDYTDVESCGSNDKCSWSYQSDPQVCQHKFGFSSLYSGIFAGSMILGCFFGSFFGGPISRLIGPRFVFLAVGITAIICSVIFHISTAVDQFWLLVVFRLIIGIALGVCCVAAPMFVAENAVPRYSKMIGVLFQVCTTLGIFLAATMGLALGQSVQVGANSDQKLMGRMQGLCVLSTVFSIFLLFLGIFLDDGRRKKKSNNNGENVEEEEIEEAPQEKKYGWGRMTGQLLVAAVVAGTLQLTGINAVMNYAPTIMGSLGLAPLLGNFIVMVWNFVTTIASVPLASVFSMRQLFVTCSLITSCMCLFLCGIPVYPGITTKQAKNGVAITGILIFIAAFEIGVGPCFYVLAQDLFPKSFRPKGASFTNVVQFVFNVIINVFYPIATEKFSGGPSGNPDKGQAIAFIFFGGVGLLCFVVQVFFLHPWEEKDEDGAEAAPAADAAANPDSHSADDKGEKDDHIDFSEARVGVTRD